MEAFDWIFYSYFYNDLRTSEINTESRALEHYHSHGQYEYRWINIDTEYWLTHSDTSGLFNNINRQSLYGVSKNFVEYLINIHKLDTSTHVLELGCGIACHAIPIIRHLINGSYYGIDTNPVCVNWCCNNIATKTKIITHFDYVDGNRFTINSPNEYYDLVYSTTTFLSISDEYLLNYLDEINRVLKKGGYLIITILIGQNFPQSMQINHAKITKNIFTNNKNEHGVIHRDQILKQILIKTHFDIKDIIFGHWSGTSTSEFYPDVVNLVKIR